MTQISASRTSWIWLVVRHMMLPKIEAWWAISIEATLMAKINPTYLLRSPVSIFTATKFMRLLLVRVTNAGARDVGRRRSGGSS